MNNEVLSIMEKIMFNKQRILESLIICESKSESDFDFAIEEQENNYGFSF